MIDGSGFGISTAAMPTVISVASSRGEGGFSRHFGTTTLNRSSSGAGSRVEGKEIGTVAGIMVGFTTGFGTVTLPTDASVASWRGEEGFYRHFGTTTLPTGTSEASRRGEGAFVKAKGAVLGNIKCDEEAACLQLGCRLSSLFL